MSDGEQLMSLVCCGACGAQLNAPHADGCPHRFEQIDLDRLEAIARAADKDNPGICFHADHVDGYPYDASAMEHFNTFDPATVLSLIRCIREFRDALAGQLGPGPSVPRDLLDKGVTRYGSMDPVADRWDVDRPVEAKS